MDRRLVARSRNGWMHSGGISLRGLSVGCGAGLVGVGG